MSDALLAKPTLPEGWQDVSVGEPYVIKDSLSKFVDLDKGYFVADKNIWEYSRPNGYKPLVDLLEEKYQAPVIITNGAKQALGAIFYTLKKLGKSSIGMMNPYWALLPPLVEAHGLETQLFHYSDGDLGKFSSPYLLLAPNNPDGQCQSYDVLREVASNYKDANVPFIHDAAYFTHTYLPSNYELGPLGDVQIFSMSKMYGLSGLRCGFAVCYNEEYAALIQEYMEMMTVGVSNISQQFLYNLLSWEKHDPEIKSEFVKDSFNSLLKAKQLIKGVNREILEVPDNMEQINGMFGFFKVGAKANFNKAKVNFIDGKLFGMPGYVRMNLALGETKLKEVIDRLNNSI